MVKLAPVTEEQQHLARRLAAGCEIMTADQDPAVLAELAAFLILDLMLQNTGKPDAVALNERVAAYVYDRVETLMREG